MSEAQVWAKAAIKAAELKREWQQLRDESPTIPPDAFTMVEARLKQFQYEALKQWVAAKGVDVASGIISTDTVQTLLEDMRKDVFQVMEKHNG